MPPKFSFTPASHLIISLVVGVLALTPALMQSANSLVQSVPNAQPQSVKTDMAHRGSGRIEMVRLSSANVLG